MSEYICELADPRYEMDWTPKEEVVRCRDCKHNAFLGKEPNWCDAIECFIEPDGFCAWGRVRA